MKIEVQFSSTESLKSDKETVAKCTLCSLHFKSQRGLKTHMKTLHNKKFTCEMCDETFEANVDLERHLESHKKPKLFKCEMCDKEFHLKWRLQKHMLGHGTKTKFCHFFNNGGNCPYEEHGCMFNHSVSPLCRFQDVCSNSLCQYRHENDSDEPDIQEHFTLNHMTTSTPIKRDTEKNMCKICKIDFPFGKKIFKCEECECDVCEICARKTIRKEDPNYFMCLICQ